MIEINEENLNQMKERLKEILNHFKNQNDFIMELFTDERISQEVKNEYAEKYNKLIIKNYSIINQ